MSMFSDHRGQQDHIDSTLAQALNNFEASNPLQQQQQQQQQSKRLSNDLLHLDHHHHHHLPIDPSIADGAHSDNPNDKETQELIRNTAQAAVNSSAKLDSETAGVIRSVTRTSVGQNQSNKASKPRINKPGQKFGAKKKSWVWNWFSQDPIDSNLATCDICGKVVKRLGSDKGSPKKLGEHLKTHKIAKDSENGKRESAVITNAVGQSSASNVPASHPGDSSNADHTAHYYNTIASSQATYKNALSSEAQASQNQSYEQQPSASASQQQQSNQTSEQSNQQGSNQSNNYNLDYDKSEFDQSAYSQSKFQKDLMKFLVDNKLPLSIVKTPSFRQVIFTLKPEAIPDLNELNHLYTSLLEVIHSEKGPLDDDEVNAALAHHVQGDERDENVDDNLANSTAGWV